MNGFQLKFMKRKPGRGKPTENPGWIHTLSSSPQNTSLIQETLSQTFECKRFHCRLLPESCIQRQKSWDPEIYQGCLGCKHGLEIARKAGAKIKPGSSKRSSPWKIPLQQRKKRKNVRLYQKIQGNLESSGVRELTAS